MEKIEYLAKRLRNIGIILGVPTIVGVAIYFHNAEIAALKEQNELLRQTQYDRALPMIEAQNKLRDHERRIVAESLALINDSLALTNDSMEYVEKFTHFRGPLPDDFSTKRFERNIQEVSAKLKEHHAKLKELHALMAEKQNGK